MLKSKMVECQNIQTQLSPYIDDELQSWKRHIIKWHLKRCSHCNKQYIDLQQTHTLLNTVEPVKTSDSFLSDVISQAHVMNINQKDKRSLLNRFVSVVDGLQIWIRGNIRTYNPFYIGSFIVGVILMLGVTLYSPKIDKLNMYSKYRTQSINTHQERLVAFEVILHNEPKRTLKIR